MVRDDGPRLRRCIQSVKESVDQVVVLDTGSKDDSVEIARSEGAIVHEIEWPNSFARGLNTLLDKIDSEWILRLDSDEWFEPEVAALLKQVTLDEEASAGWLVRRDLQPSGIYEEVGLIRLWRNHPLLRYEGVVHENIPIARFSEAWPAKRIVRTGLWFWHDGYRTGHQEKIARNVVLLEREVEANPRSAYHRAMLAKGYADLGDVRAPEAIRALVQEAIEAESSPSSVYSAVFAEYFRRLGPDELKLPATNKAVDKALQWFRGFPNVLVAISNFELRRGDRAAAFEVLLMLEEMATTGEYDRSLPVSSALWGKLFWKHLDQLADQLGRYDVCKRCEPHL